MSKIILPVDSIVITIDNRGPNPVATMKPSREMPAAQVIDIFLALAMQLNREQAVKMGLTAGGVPPATPPAGTPPNNGGGPHAA